MVIKTTRPAIRAFLIDISGNLLIGSSPTPNASSALQHLRDSGIPFRLCSNTSKESTSSLIASLNRSDFRIAADNLESGRIRRVWTSIGAVRQTMKDMGLKRPFLLLSDSAREEVEADTSSDVDGLAYDSVVVGLAPTSFNYETLNTAFRILVGEHMVVGHSESVTGRVHSSHPHVPLIATHKAKYIQTESPHGLSLGPGPFVAALETASGIKAHVVGKPSKAFYQAVIDDLISCGELEEEGEGRIAVIGDDVEADLGGGAIELGLWRILVKTGKYRENDEKRSGNLPPDEIFDTFASFIDDVLGDGSAS